MNQKEKGAVSWLWEFARPHKDGYITALILAALGVACSMVPYFCAAQIVLGLLRGETAAGFYGVYCLAAAGFWTLRYLFHGISTTLSHKSTFAVLAEIRMRLTKKLTRLPMGYLLDTPSGQLKNIVVERVDSIETTLAHIVPEMGGNLLVSIATIIYLFVLDWRMALAALIPLPLGLLCYMGMTSGYEERFANTVVKNKRLNDTAVEYIGGIEVIKAFNQSASSYEKFTTAAREPQILLSAGCALRFRSFQRLCQCFRRCLSVFCRLVRYCICGAACLLKPLSQPLFYRWVLWDR